MSEKIQPSHIEREAYVYIRLYPAIVDAAGADTIGGTAASA